MGKRLLLMLLSLVMGVSLGLATVREWAKAECIQRYGATQVEFVLLEPYCGGIVDGRSYLIPLKELRRWEGTRDHVSL